MQAVQHGLANGQPETFGAMERKIHITRQVKVFQSCMIKWFGQDADADHTGASLTERGKLSGICLRVPDVKGQFRLAGGKCAFKSLQNGQRIFAFI